MRVKAFHFREYLQRVYSTSVRIHSAGARTQMSMERPFAGFQSPTSNTTYTPNQFFDVVLATASRGAARLVAYLIRQTLGWSDADGRPQEAQVVVSYRELEEKAGIAQSKIRPALDEALQAHFIQCV